MKLNRKLAASAVIAALSMGAVSTSFVALSATQVMAKSDRSSGKGKSDAAHERSAEKKSAKTESKGKGPLKSQLKNLNAMCANSHAFAHAADGSNIGNIREYNNAYQDLVVAQQDFDGLVKSLAGGDDYDQDLYDYYNSRLSDEDIANEIAGLQGLVAADDPLVGTLNDDNELIEATTTLTMAEIATRIGGLNTYSGKLGILVEEEGDEHDAMLVASRNRELSPEALTALRNPSC